MAKLLPVFALLATLALPVVGEAGTLPGCLPSSLPTVPVPPVFALDTSDRADNNAHLDIWRHACLDGSGSAVLIRFTGAHPAYFFAVRLWLQ